MESDKQLHPDKKDEKYNMDLISLKRKAVIL
jgi:hypothetical protein